MRVEMLARGVHPGKFGSIRDRNLRAILGKEKVVNSHKLMASMAASLHNVDDANKYYQSFINTTFYENLKGDRDKDMHEYYNKHIKHLRPEMYRDADGVASVRGLN